MIKLLLVEDDPNLRYIIKGELEDTIGGYEIITAVNGEEGIKMWKLHQPEVIVAAVEMPKMNGYEMVAKIRETDTQTLILFASGKISAKDVTTGYKKGGNNYIKKPFLPEELDAHIQAMLKIKKGGQIKNESERYKLGSFYFDANNMYIKTPESRIISLTRRENEILKILIQNKGNIVKREAILEKLWATNGIDYFASRSLDVFINSLRKKLSGDTTVQIKTIKGVGISLLD